jgi:capsid protein
MASPRAMSIRSKATSSPFGGYGPMKAAFGSYRSTDLGRARPIIRDGSGDRHVDDYSRRIARELARDLDRSSGLYRSAITAFMDLSIGGGVIPSPTSANHAWNLKVDALVKSEYTDGCALDMEGTDSMGSLQRKWARSVVNDGDVLLIKSSEAGGKLVTIESDRIEGPKSGDNQYQRTTGGVKCDVQTGQRIGYYVAPYDAAGQNIVAAKAQFFKADEVIFIGTPSRKSQVRSMPALVASLDDAERVESLIESEIISAEQASQLWGVLKDPAGTETGGQNPLAPTNGDGSPALGGFPSGPNGGTTNVPFQDFVAGLIGFIGNREFQQIKTERPNLNVTEFAKAVLRIFIAELGVPYEMAMLDVGSLSWSGNKALLSFAERRLQVWRDQVFGPAFSAIYRWRVRSWISQGLLDDVPDWSSHIHNWPLPPATDGPDQVKTDEGNIALGKTNLHRLVGPGWKRVLDERALEIVHAAQLAFDITKQFPDAKVEWRDLIGGPGNIGISAAPAQDNLQSKQPNSTTAP